MSTQAYASPLRLQSLVDGLAAKTNLPHAVLEVQNMSGTFRWGGAAGQASPDGRTMTVGTPFFIASIDKVFVATVVLQLHEEQALSIDDPVTRHLDPDRIDGLHRLRGVDYTERITIRDLLAHTSGLPDYLEDHPKKGPSFVERIFAGEDREVTLDEMLRIVREELSSHFPPQTADTRKQKARYSDTNYQILIAIVEAVCGRPIHEVMAERIFRPLELGHTWYFGFSEPAESTPPPAMLRVCGELLDRRELLKSLHSVYSTTGDLIAFLRALMRGELFRDAATLRLMQRTWNRFGVPRDRASLRSPSWPIEYAFGLKRFRLPRAFTPFVPMPAVIGHTGSTGTWLFYCPELDVFIAGAVNQATAGAVPFRLVPKVLRILARADEAIGGG